jgi:hypothetical protein
MFKFFKSKEPEQVSKVSISYLIDQNDTPLIDITLKDYSEDSIKALCSLLDVLSKDSFYVSTVQMIYDTLSSNGKDDIVMKVLTHISQQDGDKISKFVDKSKESQMCIKPSDAIF